MQRTRDDAVEWAPPLSYAGKTVLTAKSRRRELSRSRAIDEINKEWNVLTRHE